MLLNHLKVLIVDDLEDSRMLITFILEAAGAEVTAVTRAIEAFAMLERSPFDLLLSDIVMPDMDGYAFIKAIRAYEAMQVNSIQAIALTAMAGAKSYQNAISAGFHDCLFKPIEPDALVMAIAHLTNSTRCQARSSSITNSTFLP